MSFLPTDYEAPQATGGIYFKPKEGETHKIRVLSDAVTGFLYWNDQNKPVRLKDQPIGVPEDIRINEDGAKDRVKHFWALMVWNVDEKLVQLWEITQSSIRGFIQDYASDDDWGHPKGYGLKVKRTGKGLDTEYSVIASPKSPLPADAIAAWKDMLIDLDELFRGADVVNPATQLLGAAGMWNESRALRAYQDMLTRSIEASQLDLAEDWALKHIAEIAQHTDGDETRAREVIEMLKSQVITSGELDDIAF